MAATKNLARYVKDKAVNLSVMSCATGVPYSMLCESLGDTEQERPLSIDEICLVCKFLEVSPLDFADSKDM